MAIPGRGGGGGGGPGESKLGMWIREFYHSVLWPTLVSSHKVSDSHQFHQLYSQSLCLILEGAQQGIDVLVPQCICGLYRFSTFYACLVGSTRLLYWIFKYSLRNQLQSLSLDSISASSHAACAPTKKKESHHGSLVCVVARSHVVVST